MRNLHRTACRASSWAIAISLATAAAAQEAAPATAQETPVPQSGTVLRTGVPAGFDDIDTSVQTLFDLTFQDARVGSFSATLKDGLFSFDDPAAIAAALGEAVNREGLIAFLSKPLPANEQFRCRPGQNIAVGCGILPAGASGVIVNVDSFGVTLFLPRELLTTRIVTARELGPPMSGPSLIQNIRMSASSSDGDLNYGGTFSTLASLGRTALIGRTTLTDASGFRSEELYAQHIWAERRAAAGLMQDYRTLTLNSYRMLGAEFGSFFGTRIDPGNDSATPVEVLLPKRVQVEVYRYGVLVMSAQYDAGLQLIDTRALPDGTYSIRIVARDGNQIVLDETRTFSRLNTSLPAGKIGFRLRAGERVRDDIFSTGTFGEETGFLPRTTGEFVVSGSLQRRLGPSMIGGVTATSFGSQVFGEGSLEVSHGIVSGLVGVGGGSGGAYSALITGTVQFPRISVFLSARRMHVDDDNIAIDRLDRYQPYFRTQDNIFGSVQMRALGGSVNVSGSYTRSPTLPKRHTLGLQYTRSMQIARIGTAMLAAGASKSDIDTRFGFAISFFRRVDRKTTASFTGGGQYVSETMPGGGRRGFSPVAGASLSRVEQMGSTEVLGEVGVSTDADSDQAIARLRALSNLGTADVAAQWRSRAFGDSEISYQFNGESGFAIGGGAVKLGLRNPAESMVLVDLGKVRARPVEPELDNIPADTVAGPDSGAGAVGAAGTAATPDAPPPPRVAEGGYRVTIDGRAQSYVGPGSRVALGVQPLGEYVVGLRPEGAPQFDLDATQRSVTVYPGNVVRVRFEAQKVISLFGQVLDAAGRPLRAARVEAGSDVALADDRGYFTITAPMDSTMSIRTPGGELCLQRAVGSLADVSQPALLYRFGQIRCESGVNATERRVPAAVSAVQPPASDATTVQSENVPTAAAPERGITEASSATGASTETSSMIPQKRDVPVLIALARADLDYLDMVLGRPATRTL